ncbi:transposase [Bradyrhizobium vignae]|uniref:Transposase IS116/IS110/IS902 C-terminal domain-containing protein n=1 Tax=Bradyrhizobium vignae TaxID=1549949 RepID=A0A2U3QA61_9BRAD|nr:transposase [Bradyrhizobium vignae]SPP98276.1 protein of unknown function [Bradyrhizobium vignae]
MAKLEVENGDVPNPCAVRCWLWPSTGWRSIRTSAGSSGRSKAAGVDRDARRLMEVPCVGPMITSTALAKMADLKLFRSGQDFAAWIGLIGKDHGGSKHRPARISKQGDRMLRTLLINGASAYLRHQRNRGVSDPWPRALLARRLYKVVMAALAAKTARIIWAMLEE